MLALGMVKISLYYKVYNISIISFLDISEIIQLQFTLYIILLWSILVFGPGIYFLLNKVCEKVIYNIDNVNKSANDRLAMLDNDLALLKNKIVWTEYIEYIKNIKNINQYHNIKNWYLKLAKASTEAKLSVNLFSLF